MTLKTFGSSTFKSKTFWLFTFRGASVSIEVKPIVSGGGTTRPNLPYIEDYAITVTISYNGKSWKQSKIISGLVGNSLEKILASFKGLKSTTISVLANISSVIANKINVFVKRKH